LKIENAKLKMILQSYNKKDRIVNLPPPLQAIGDDDESDQFLVQ